MRILFAITEAYPFIKVGGLADVGGALPKALARRGHEVRLLLPGYPLIGLGRRVLTLDVPMGPITERVEIRHHGRHGGVEVYSAVNDSHFGTDAPYGGYLDDDVVPFVFFSRAVSALAARPGWRPDVIHCNDWHVGLLPQEVRSGPHLAALARTGTVLTIHNLAYQGHYGPEAEPLVGPYNGPEDSLLARGIASADIVNTVSPHYREEIISPEYGMGLDSLLRSRSSDLYGILNGVDYDEFDPRTDPHLAVRYGISFEEGKLGNKVALQEMSGLPVDPQVPLLGWVARLVQQKGVEVLCTALDELVSLGAQVVVVGKGEGELQARLESVAAHYPAAVAYHCTAEEPLSRLVYAASDLFLAPSSFEPCGLSPLIALRYGSIPIVRRTGGLMDTIRDYDRDPASGLGFTYVRKYHHHLVKTVEKALQVYRRREEWRALRKRAMTADFSWDGPTRRYEEVYRRAVAQRRRRAAIEITVRSISERREEHPRRRVPLALVHHANQYLITNGYGDRQGISDVVAGYTALLRLHEKYGVPASLHLSGTLIETVAWHCPWFLDLIKDLRKKGLLSLIGGTYSENVMPLFSPLFNRRQLDELFWLYEHHLGCHPEDLSVCWIPERVWDTQTLSPVLTDSDLPNGGYRHVLLDDRLLYSVNGSYAGSPRARFDASGPFGLANGHPPQSNDMSGKIESCKAYRISGANGLTMVPISAALRYRIPPSSAEHWRDLKQMLAVLARDGTEDTILVYADDMERTSGVGGWSARALKHYEGFLRWVASRAEITAVTLPAWLAGHQPREERAVETGAFFELARGWQAGEDYRGWWENAAWTPYKNHLVSAQEAVHSAQQAGADRRLIELAWKHLMASAYETAWHDPKENGCAPAPWAKAVASHSRACRVIADAARWYAQ